MLPKEIEQHLSELTSQLTENEVIQAYLSVKQKVDANENLKNLQEQIKTAQQEAVSFAHYGKPVAEQAALKKADELTKQFDEHPLVVAYRTRLLEANDLLQHLTQLIQQELNHAIKEDIDASKNQTYTDDGTVLRD